MNQVEHYEAGMAALRKAETLASQKRSTQDGLTEQAARVCALAAVGTAHFAAASARAHMTPDEQERADDDH